MVNARRGQKSQAARRPLYATPVTWGRVAAKFCCGGRGAALSGWQAPPLAKPETRPVKARLDAIDWKILRELQADGRMTNVELASRVGISAPPCLRRVRALEEMGVIRGYRALLAAERLGYGVTVFAMVHLASQAEADLNAFAEKVRHWPVIRECHTVSGDFDFVMKCVAPDLASFQHFVGELTATPNVRNVRTVLTLGQVKDEAAVPLEIPPAD
ncbi:MAG: Lrp/AsnC family transcriptional regulator [Phreatobacter oligotrophus]|nr:Lrp/AsnC family transcriptional regulator [Phreatobacter oligotrophus]